MKIRLLCITISLFCFLFLINLCDLSADMRSVKSDRLLVVRNDISKIISSGISACENQILARQNKKQKKVTICPIQAYESSGLLSISSKKFLTKYFYKVRNLIYIVCFLFLVFIWARIYWQKFPEWKLFYSIVMILVITTIASASIKWYLLPEEIYLYNCNRPNMLWKICNKGKDSIAVSRKHLIILNDKGDVIKRKISNKSINRLKVNMFY